MKATVGSLAVVFTIFGMLSVAVRADDGMSSDVNTPCLGGELSPSGADPCLLREQAQGFMSKLAPGTAESLQKISAEFDLERNLRIQQALFREDLNWMQRGYSDRQIDLMVFVAVALSLERAKELEVELREVMKEKPEPKVARRLESVVLYQSQALSMLDRMSRELENVRDYELKFYY
jgi:hypothetical protein